MPSKSAPKILSNFGRLYTNVGPFSIRFSFSYRTFFSTTSHLSNWHPTFTGVIRPGKNIFYFHTLVDRMTKYYLLQQLFNFPSTHEIFNFLPRPQFLFILTGQNGRKYSHKRRIICENVRRIEIDSIALCCNHVSFWCASPLVPCFESVITFSIFNPFLPTLQGKSNSSRRSWISVFRKTYSKPQEIDWVRFGPGS